VNSDDRYARFIADFCQALELNVDDVLGRCREAGPVMLARFALTYLLRERFRLSYPALGRILKRDHTTCINSRQKFSRMLANNDRFAIEVMRKTGGVGVPMLDLEGPLDTLRRCTAGIELATEAV